MFNLDMFVFLDINLFYYCVLHTGAITITPCFFLFKFGSRRFYAIACVNSYLWYAFQLSATNILSK